MVDTHPEHTPVKQIYTIAAHACPGVCLCIWVQLLLLDCLLSQASLAPQACQL